VQTTSRRLAAANSDLIGSLPVSGARVAFTPQPLSSDSRLRRRIIQINGCANIKISLAVFGGRILSVKMCDFRKK